MKFKVICVLLLSIFIMGYSSGAEASTMVKEPIMSHEQSILAQNSLRIINSVSDVRRGGIGVITIQGAPNTLYSIQTSYKLSNKTVFVTQWRTTDSTGVTTFNWVVSMKTMAGTYDATISGGGYAINTKHRVAP
ncbi:hypothetical protein [Clostridium lacusfryxellense]|uniref:hypothetical protein n=1 Tax=Clostridium lacusfryxellense TaxID=205328 RepID=UPI001C0B817D|nr:hypothetical protein [Clostridium lacusfryxellense]MBU3111368.1 hypothetical protein [Clostridium lacusfryxellense]